MKRLRSIFFWSAPFVIALLYVLAVFGTSNAQTKVIDSIHIVTPNTSRTEIIGVTGTGAKGLDLQITYRIGKQIAHATITEAMIKGQRLSDELQRIASLIGHVICFSLDDAGTWTLTINPNDTNKCGERHSDA